MSRSVSLSDDPIGRVRKIAIVVLINQLLHRACVSRSPKHYMPCASCCTKYVMFAIACMVVGALVEGGDGVQLSLYPAWELAERVSYHELSTPRAVMVCSAQKS